MRRPIHSNPLLIAALLAVHAGLLAWGAWRHAPCFDEFAHLPSGISHWYFGRFDLFLVNPPLVRMVAALPVMAAGAKTDWSDYDDDSTSRSEFRVGQRFAAINGRRTFWLFTIARWACVPFSIIGALVCYAWARQLYGPWPGMLALTLWCFSPNILGHAQLITADAPAAAMGILAGYTFWRWLRACCPTAIGEGDRHPLPSTPAEKGTGVEGKVSQSPAAWSTWGAALWAGLALGLCELTKSTWILLFGLWPAIWVVWRGRQLFVVSCQLFFRGSRPKSEIGDVTRSVSEGTTPQSGVRKAVSGGVRLWVQGVQLALVLAIAVYAINFGYGFENTFQRLGDIPFVSKVLGDPTWGTPPPPGFNRFRGTWMEGIRVPLPANYVRGIDVQKRSFEQNQWSYLRGQWRHDGWWYYYLYALGVKVPLGTWGLVALTLVLGLFRRGYAATWRDELCPLAPLIVVLLLVSSQTDMNHHMRYVLPMLPFAFVWMSKGARSFQFSVFSFQFGSNQRWLWPVSRPSHTKRPKVSTSERSGEAAAGSGDSRPTAAGSGDSRPTAELDSRLRGSDGGSTGPARQAGPTRFDRIVAVAVVLCVAASVGSSLWVYPHSLSYFNELVGGPRYGYLHLDNSNIDWGQDLLYLKRWYDKHPEARPLGVQAFWGFPDPKLAGIDAGEVPALPHNESARAMPPDSFGPLPGWYAVSVNRLIDRSRAYAYFLDLEPVGRAGYSIYIYHLTLEDANRLRRAYGLPELAADTPPESQP